MSRKKKRRREPFLKDEAKHSILAIVFVSLAVVLILSGIHRAGPVGEVTFNALDRLFGLGYFIIPALLIIVGTLFVVGEHTRLVGVTIAGASIFLIAVLGLMDIFSPGAGGLLGKITGWMGVMLGRPAGVVISIALMSVGTIISLNMPIRFSLKKREKVKPAKKELANIPDFPPDYEEDEEVLIPHEEEAEEEEEIEEVIEEEKSKKEKKKEKEDDKLDVHKTSFKNYVPPPSSLLKSSTDKPTSGDLRANANMIKRTLESFGIAVEMGEITIGPKVTRYTMKPAEGVKLSRITALNQDLSLALAAHPIRIEAPIPGKALVGIEIPNKTASIVRLGSLIGYSEFTKAPHLTCALGRDVSGEPIFANLAKMPHLLIAGTTGSGKSITIHTLLISLLYKNSPETLRLILIDPKRVELSVYEDLPHLMAPVITDGKKAVAALRFALEEMDRRYGTLLNNGKRDILGYNQDHKENPMPYIVIVIDELADLMMTFGREVENSIVRLAQMARATGIHLVVSTQRPSVEVITGLIKANINSRIALQVASQVDSRTILDMSGAEKLLGGGDMLFTSTELSKPKRIQGGYLTNEEVEAVAEFIKENNQPEESDELEESAESSLEQKISEVDFGDDEDDLLPDAINVVRESQKASASLLQRRLKVGYARAARLLDIMEDKGIIGPGDGAKPREVFLDSSE